MAELRLFTFQSLISDKRAFFLLTDYAAMGRIPATILLYGALAANLFVAAQGKELWSSQPAITSDFIRTAYLLGNGRLGGRIST